MQVPATEILMEALFGKTLLTKSGQCPPLRHSMLAIGPSSSICQSCQEVPTFPQPLHVTRAELPHLWPGQDNTKDLLKSKDVVAIYFSAHWLVNLVIRQCPVQEGSKYV